MAHKLTLRHLPFLFILGYLINNCILFSAYAAPIAVASNRAYALETIIKNKMAPIPIEAQESNPPSYFFIEPTDFDSTSYQEMHRKPTYNNNSVNSPDNKLHKWKKQFLIDSNDNEAIQNTFNTLKSTRQLFIETGLEIHEPTNNIALSLNLDTPSKNDQLPTYKPENILSRYSTSSQVFVSDPNGWDKATYSSATGHKQTLSEFLSPIFNFQNLLIFIGIIIFFITSIKISKIMLLRKQKYRS